MSKMLENVKYLEEALKEFNPVVLDYNKDMVVGFPNDINGNDLVIYVKETEMVMTFGYQNAHFDVEDVKSCAEHSKKYLNSEYASVEFFMKAKDLFGGSRLSSTVDFSTVDKIADCYSCGNEEVKNNLLEFFKKNKDITVRAVTFDNSINTVIKIVYENDTFKTEVIRG